MLSNAYSLTLPGFVQRHFGSRVMLVRDRAEPRDPKLDALARSGDYFITLSTQLDTLATELTEINLAVASLTLARLADELAYIQKHYAVVRKDRPDRLTELG